MLLQGCHTSLSCIQVKRCCNPPLHIHTQPFCTFKSCWRAHFKKVGHMENSVLTLSCCLSSQVEDGNAEDGQTVERRSRLQLKHLLGLGKAVLAAFWRASFYGALEVIEVTLGKISLAFTFILLYLRRRYIIATASWFRAMGKQDWMCHKKVLLWRFLKWDNKLAGHFHFPQVKGESEMQM